MGHAFDRRLYNQMIYLVYLGGTSYSEEVLKIALLALRIRLKGFWSEINCKSGDFSLARKKTPVSLAVWTLSF